MGTTLYEQMGGEGKVRAIIEQFVDRMVDDVMIGFFFRKVNVRRLKELEFQHAAAFLGGPVAYEGRPLPAAHGPHKIQGGQFARRIHMLRQVLQEQQVPAAVVEAWLAHQESLRAQITRAADNGCEHNGETTNNGHA